MNENNDLFDSVTTEDVRLALAEFFASQKCCRCNMTVKKMDISIVSIDDCLLSDTRME